MEKLLQFVAAHEVGIGLLGTVIVVLAVVVGFRRSDRRRDERAVPPGKTHP